MLLFCTMVYVFFVLMDVIPIIRNKNWKVLVIYAVLMMTAYTFTVLTEFGVKIPSPSNPIKQVVISVFGK